MLVNNKGLRNHKMPWHWVRPDFLATTVADINFKYLEQQGIKAIFLDLDGTVVERRTF
jgi:predicted HAD superfamily phosphohydrolase YqeG